MGNFGVVPLLLSVSEIEMALQGLDAGGSDKTVTKLRVRMSNFVIV
jgi:hypothetical protein